MEKFSCQRCTKCCHFDPIRNVNISIPGFRGGNLIYLKQPTLTILPWEVHLFPKEHVFPCTAVFDTKNNTLIILDYCLDVLTCPNLDGKDCKVYEKRPVTCRAYPCPYGDSDDVTFDYHPSSDCPSEVPLVQLNEMLGVDSVTSTNAIKKRLYDRYGSAFVHKFLSTIYTKEILKLLVELEQKGSIKTARLGYDMKPLLKRIENAKRIDVTDFLKETTGFEYWSLFSDEAVIVVEQRLKVME